MDKTTVLTVLGVSLKSLEKNSSTVVVLDAQTAEILDLKTFLDDEGLLEMVRGKNPDELIISNGSPMSLPQGLHCLDREHACESVDQAEWRKGRRSELEMSRMGISCFFTNKRTIIRPLIERGIQLKRKLIEEGYGDSVIEVFPHASKVVLFGDGVPPKKDSLEYMKEHLPPLIPGLGTYVDSLDINTCDALVNAYTGFLHSREETDTLGEDPEEEDPEEGGIVLPKLPR